MQLVTSLSELLGAGAEGAEQPKEALPLPEAQLATLREMYDTYRSGCPFKEGDFIVPRPGMTVEGMDRPHVVVEVFDPPIRNFSETDETSESNMFGRRLDLRVMCFHSGKVAAFYVESWQFDRWHDTGGEVG